MQGATGQIEHEFETKPAKNFDAKTLGRLVDLDGVRSRRTNLPLNNVVK